jgi:hypothetical protein
LAEGVRDALVSGGFSTIKSICKSTTSDISTRVGIDQYIARIILEEAKRCSTEIAKVPPSFGDDAFDATAPAIKEEDFLSYP